MQTKTRETLSWSRLKEYDVVDLHFNSTLNACAFCVLCFCVLSWLRASRLSQSKTDDTLLDNREGPLLGSAPVKARSAFKTYWNGLFLFLFLNKHFKYKPRTLHTVYQSKSQKYKNKREREESRNCLLFILSALCALLNTTPCHLSLFSLSNHYYFSLWNKISSLHFISVLLLQLTHHFADLLSVEGLDWFFAIVPPVSSECPFEDNFSSS